MPQMLSKPMAGEGLYIYIFIGLTYCGQFDPYQEDMGTQKPTYYTSKILWDSEIRYLKVEKMIYMIITSAWRLQPYFQAHSMVVLTHQPLKFIL